MKQLTQLWVVPQMIIITINLTMIYFATLHLWFSNELKDLQHFVHAQMLFNLL